jgi:chemotaxis protein CheX
VSAMEELADSREDLEALLLDVLASVLGEEAVPVTDDLPPGPQAIARLAIHDEIEDSYLGVMVRLGMPLATVAACRMMSVADPGADDVIDAVGELGNISGGNVKSLLCNHARLSLPEAEVTDVPPAGADEFVHVRALVLGQVVELSVYPTADVSRLYWPPHAAGEPTRLEAQL